MNRSIPSGDSSRARGRLTLAASSRSSMRIVAEARATGQSFRQTSAMMPREPNAPTAALCRSKPETFLTTRPPERTTRPSPVTAVTSRTRSLIPRWRALRSGARPVASTPPNVACPGFSGSTAVWSLAESRDSRSPTPMPAPATTVRSSGSQTSIWLSFRVETTQPPGGGLPIFWRVPPPHIRSGTELAEAAFTIWTRSSTLAGTR